MKIGILPSTLLAVSSLVAVGSPTQASAMNLSSRGLGQVLEFPYYTVNGNQQTVLTLVNYSAAVKAVKVRFREAYDGRAVASFNVYLSPFDVWTGTVFKDGSTVAVGSRDTSCTVPKFDASVSSVNIPAFAFSTTTFTGTQSDGGPTDSSRLREGHFEIFEMGEVSSDAHGLETATYHDNGVPRDCAKVVSAWNAGGVWASAPVTDLSPPTGKLLGSSGVVNVSTGTYFAIQPSVIDGFSNSVQHSAPVAKVPDFDTASPGTDNEVAVSVDIDGQLINTRFRRAVDAVSALFMTSQSINEYAAIAGSGEQTDWITTFPTKRWYVDPALNTTGLPSSPFESMFGDTTLGGSCVAYQMSLFNREELTITPATCGFECPPSSTAALSFCHETSVIPLTKSGSVLHTALDENLAATHYLDSVAALGEGYIEFDVGADSFGHLLTSDEGIVFFGLPLTGFVAENFINANVTPGVLANYSAAVPHRSILTCSRTGSGASASCP